MNVMRLTQLALLAVPCLLFLLLNLGGCRPLDADLRDFSLALLIALLHSVHRQVKELPSIPSLLGCNVLAMVVLFILFPPRCRNCGQLTACKSNVKNIATSLEMYSTDNAGHYPQSLSQLTPKYLKVIPQCPTAQRDTYSLHYFRAEKPEDAYTVGCGGCYHHAAGVNEPGYPQYSSYSGLIMP
jgi:hypothetical protein